MQKVALKYILIFTFLIFGNTYHSLLAQSGDSPILFIYDASGSMWGKLGNETKKEAAADVLTEAITKLDADQKIGFMAYGHRKKGDCNDVELMIGLENTDKSLINSTVKNLNPLGKTPLAFSAELAINSIKESNYKATIILITDGIESCNGDLCKVVQLAREAGVDFKLHVVGFGLKNEDLASLKCAAKEGNGNYYDAKDATQLSEVLNEAVQQKVDDPDPNHSFYATKNGEPVDVWVKIVDKQDGSHVAAARSYGDTAFVHIPIGEYNVTINPLAGTDIASKSMVLNKTEQGESHNTISFDGGIVQVFIRNNNEGWDATVKVINKETQKIVATNRTYGRTIDIEVNEGTYEVNILALNMKGLDIKYKFEEVIVKAKETTAIGHDFKSGIISIGAITVAGELVDAAIKIKDSVSKKYVAGGRTYTSESSNPKSINILPGVYDVQINTLGKHKGTTKTATLEVTSNKETTKIFKIQ